MYNKAIKYGALTGVLILLYFVLVYLIIGDIRDMTLASLQSLEMLSFVRYVLIVLGVYFTLSNVQSVEKNYSFIKLFKAGIVTSLIIALFVGVMEFLYLVVNPDYYEVYMQLFLETARTAGATEEEMSMIADELKRNQWLHTPLMTGSYYFLETLFISAVATIVTGALLKNKRNKNKYA